MGYNNFTLILDQYIPGICSSWIIFPELVSWFKSLLSIEILYNIGTKCIYILFLLLRIIKPLVLQ